MTIQTEVDFILPRGYVDAAGGVHRQGRMRLALAVDEVEAAAEPRVQLNEAYLPVVLLSRVITQLGELPAITPQIVERLFAADLAYLEDLYMRLNSHESVVLTAICPACSTHFQVQVAPITGEAV